MEDLGTLGGKHSAAWAINNRGEVVGVAASEVNTTLAFVYRKGVMSEIGVSGHAFGINDSGEVTGLGTWPDLKEGIHAFVYSKGTIVDIGTLGGLISAGRAINNAGWVVGFAERWDGQARAFVYHDGKIYDLNEVLTEPIGGVLFGAMSINGSGCIVAFSQDSHGYLLVPVRGTGSGR